MGRNHCSRCSGICKWFFLKRGTCCKNGCKNCPYS
nr:DUF5522 domain-containing protein [uncultured Pseudoalteromonas sp.]